RVWLSMPRPHGWALQHGRGGGPTYSTASPAERAGISSFHRRHFRAPDHLLGHVRARHAYRWAALDVRHRAFDHAFRLFGLVRHGGHDRGPGGEREESR